MSLFRLGDMDDVFGQMDRMMNQMMGMGNMFQRDPFGMMPFGMRAPPQIPQFPVMPNLMTMMNNPMNGTSMPTNTRGAFFSQSVVNFSSDGRNPPQVVEQTYSNRVGPGGVREEKRTLRDSRSGVQKMSVGRHIQDRGHIMERSRNQQTGEEEESSEYINIEEEEEPQFTQEFTSRMANASQYNRNQYIQAPRREPILAITGPEPNHYPHVPSTSSDSQHRNSVDKKLRIKPTVMKKDKKAKKPYRKE